jgi:hypothetical protein
MKPSVGRVVHYVSYGTPNGEYTSQCRAAIVTEICDNPGGIDPETGTLCTSLFVANPTGLFLNQHVPQDEDAHAGGTWHWPERESA